jgi:hypothetical protein
MPSFCLVSFVSFQTKLLRLFHRSKTTLEIVSPHSCCNNYGWASVWVRAQIPELASPAGLNIKPISSYWFRVQFYQVRYFSSSQVRGSVFGLSFTSPLKFENFSSDPPCFFYTPLKSNFGPQNGIHLETITMVFTNRNVKKSRFIETMVF